MRGAGAHASLEEQCIPQSSCINTRCVRPPALSSVTGGQDGQGTLGLCPIDKPQGQSLNALVHGNKPIKTHGAGGHSSLSMPVKPNYGKGGTPDKRALVSLRHLVDLVNLPGAPARE